MRDDAPELNDAEFSGTFAEPMKALAASPHQGAAESCARAALESRCGHQEYPLQLSNVYADGGGRYVHFLFWYGVPNVYVVVVVSAIHGDLLGYHRLDLNEKYGRPSPTDRVWRPYEE